MVADKKKLTPGHVFVTYRYEDRNPVPVEIDIRDAGTTEKAFVAETVGKYLGEPRIPDLEIACFNHDDIDALPTCNPPGAARYLKENQSIEEQNRERVVWHRNLVEAAYCIENGRDDYCDQHLKIGLLFDPKFALYRVVNDLRLRHFYRDMSDTLRAELLRRLNEENPKLEMKELPKIGETTRRDAPDKKKGRSI